MFTAWQKGMLSDLVIDEINRMGTPKLEMDKMRVTDLWEIYYTLEGN